MMGIVDDTDGDGRKRVSPGNRDARLGGTDEFVAASWLRSQAAGVSPEGGDIRYIGDVDVASRLVHYAQPVLEKLIEYTEDVPLSVAVSDNKGRVLSRLDTNSTIGALVDTISLAPGFSYAESEVGTTELELSSNQAFSPHCRGGALSRAIPKVFVFRRPDSRPTVRPYRGCTRFDLPGRALDPTASQFRSFRRIDDRNRIAQRSRTEPTYPLQRLLENGSKISLTTACCRKERPDLYQQSAEAPRRRRTKNNRPTCAVSRGAGDKSH